MDIWQWREEFARAALRYAVLAALSHRDAHGYQLLTYLKEKGFGNIKGGTLYPVLTRMEDEGLLCHSWDTSNTGPARKILMLTDEGRSQVEIAQHAWKDISLSLQMLTSTAT